MTVVQTNAPIVVRRTLTNENASCDTKTSAAKIPIVKIATACGRIETSTNPY